MLYNRRMIRALRDLAYHLCPAGEPATTQARRAMLWSGNMAVLAGQEAIARDTGYPGGGAAYLQRLRARLMLLLRSDLPAPERADAGVALAHLDDPRFRAAAWYLPEEPLLGFVEIPAGPFQMGSDRASDADAFEDEQPQHEVNLPRYYIARYPVIVVQFRAFVQASGYQLKHAEQLRELLPNHRAAGRRVLPRSSARALRLSSQGRRARLLRPHWVPCGSGGAPMMLTSESLASGESRGACPSGHTACGHGRREIPPHARPLKLCIFSVAETSNE